MHITLPHLSEVLLCIVNICTLLIEFKDKAIIVVCVQIAAIKKGKLQFFVILFALILAPQNKLGDTPLHAASWKGRLECVRTLIEAGADVHIRNRAGRKAVDLAAADPEVSALLRASMRTQREADAEAADYSSGDDAAAEDDG